MTMVEKNNMSAINTLNKEVLSFAKAVALAGGNAYLVGGAVRDGLMNRPVHDHDFVVTGLSQSRFEREFKSPPQTGNLFPVYRLEIGGEECEVALARTEKKEGEGHKGFKVAFDENVTIEADLFRRDLTINAMAIDLLAKNIVDPFGGVDDVKKGILRAVSHHFDEDPLRVLRVARMATTFGFEVEDGTLRLMEGCRHELSTLPSERIWKEMEKALQADTPSRFFRVLQSSNTLKFVFPELFALIGKTQPLQFHPEGDAFEHSLLVLDEVAKKTTDVGTRFAALTHDIGKGLTPLEMLPRHYHHDKVGAELIRSWVNGRFPARMKRVACLVAEHHMKASHLDEMRPSKVFDLLQAVKGELEAFRTVVEADTHQHFTALSDEFVRRVFGKVEIPDRFNPKQDGSKIADFVRQERIRRVREML